MHTSGYELTVRCPLEAPYTGPFKVLERNEKGFIIELDSGNEHFFSFGRLKPVTPSRLLLPDPKPTKTPTTDNGTDELSTEEDTANGLLKLTAFSDST